MLLPLLLLTASVAADAVVAAAAVVLLLLLLLLSSLLLLLMSGCSAVGVDVGTAWPSFKAINRKIMATDDRNAY